MIIECFVLNVADCNIAVTASFAIHAHVVEESTE